MADQDKREATAEDATSLLRTFIGYAIAAAVAVIVLYALGARVAFTYYMMREAERRAIDIGETVLNHEIETFIRDDAYGRPHIDLSGDLARAMERRVVSTLPLVGVIKVKVYDTDSRIVYSNDRGIIGVTDSGNEMLSRSLAGDVVSEVQTKDTVWDLAGERRYNLDLVETYLPLRDPNGEIAGVAELYMDVAEYRVETQQLLVSSILVVVAVVGAVFLVFSLLIWRAQNIIRAKATEIRVLRGLLPICAHCKSIRDDGGEWHRLETYIVEHSESTFTHGICPECLAREYGDLLGRRGDTTPKP